MEGNEVTKEMGQNEVPGEWGGDRALSSGPVRTGGRPFWSCNSGWERRRATLVNSRAEEKQENIFHEKNGRHANT